MTIRKGGNLVIRAMIFDLDGTLVQTERLKALSYAQAAVELCKPDPEIYLLVADELGLMPEECLVVQ